MKTLHLLSAAALLASAFASPIAGAVPLKTDPAKSGVAAVFKQMNVPVEAKFKTFTANIDYDAARPEASKATVDITTASIDLGDAEYNREVAKKEWFNTAQFPKASFTSTSIKAAGPGKLNVAGKLTLKGRVADVSFPLTVRSEAGKQVFEGQLPIRRLAFNIGEGEWKDTSMVADEVVIKFRVTAGK
ncbi:YceI family protein [Massilia niabensis]|uniref:YceI family protein n=1 Tax=Massilia niabensis TaxID=544910 RepID=A0ABW0L3U5_9BURK